MPSPYFRFKQFTVFHDKCAMKVGTDGVLLGAWTNVDNAATILDIGTGTGLIALMLAQRNSKSLITAIDIDENAILQAKQNIGQSAFSNRIDCRNIALHEFMEESSTRYDLIVSNPPFFKDSLKPPSMSRTLARHTDSLPVDKLVTSASLLVAENGSLSLIYPFDYKEQLKTLAAEYGLYASRITNVFPTPLSETPKRVLIELTKKDIGTVENDLVIETQRHIYSDEFTKLVKDFYLKL